MQGVGDCSRRFLAPVPSEGGGSVGEDRSIKHEGCGEVRRGEIVEVSPVGWVKHGYAGEHCVHDGRVELWRIPPEPSARSPDLRYASR